MEKKEPNLKSTAFLRDALLDAEILLSYASEYGKSIDPKYIEAIVIAKRNEQNDNWTEKEEIEFWIAFQAVSKTIRPVSIDSLRAASITKERPINAVNKFLGRKPKSMVEKSVAWYRIMAILFMLTMLSLQIYSLIGTAQLAKYNENYARNLEIEQKMKSLIIITSSNPEDKSSSNEKTNLEEEREELNLEVQSGIQLLENWLNFTPNVISKGTSTIVHQITGTSDTLVENELPFASQSNGMVHNIVIVQQAKSLVIILNQYILPLLYGLLGGFAFVLRELSRETKSLTYTPTSNIKYGLRINLGALAGLVIGFLWGDLQGKSFGVAESLSPLAVAFLAGYSVDFLFRMLDSVIGTARTKADDTASNDQAKITETETKTENG